RPVVEHFEPPSVIPYRGGLALARGKLGIEFRIPLSDVVAGHRAVSTAPTNAPFADVDGHAVADAVGPRLHGFHRPGNVGIGPRIRVVSLIVATERPRVVMVEGRHHVGIAPST